MGTEHGRQAVRGGEAAVADAPLGQRLPNPAPHPLQISSNTAAGASVTVAVPPNGKQRAALAGQQRIGPCKPPRRHPKAAWWIANGNAPPTDQACPAAIPPGWRMPTDNWMDLKTRFCSLLRAVRAVLCLMEKKWGVTVTHYALSKWWWRERIPRQRHASCGRRVGCRVFVAGGPLALQALRAAHWPAVAVALPSLVLRPCLCCRREQLHTDCTVGAGMPALQHAIGNSLPSPHGAKDSGHLKPLALRQLHPLHCQHHQQYVHLNQHQEYPGNLSPRQPAQPNH